MSTMHEYLFDVKLFCSLRIKAETQAAAEKQIEELLNCATANFGMQADGSPLIAEVTLDTEDGAELLEIDGEIV